MAVFLVHAAPNLVLMPAFACEEYLDQYRRNGELTTEPAPGMGLKIDGVICVRRNGTAYDANGEVPPPKILLDGQEG